VVIVSRVKRVIELSLEERRFGGARSEEKLSRVANERCIGEMQIRRVAIVLSVALILIVGCGRRTGREVPESGLLRALAHPGDLRVLSSPIPKEPPDGDAVRTVEESLELRRVDEAKFAGPLSFPIIENEGFSLYVGEEKLRGQFDLVRANTDRDVQVDPETFRLRKVDYPRWKPAPDGGSGLWWQGGEVVADLVVQQTGFYDVTLTARGMRVFESVPRLELLVDGQGIREFDLPVPSRDFRARVSAGAYIEKGNHTIGVRFVKRVRNTELRMDMAVFVLALELVPKDMVAVPAEHLTEGTEVTARYKTKDVASEQWQLFAKEHSLIRTDQGLYVSGEAGLEVQGESRPAIFAPPGTVFEWSVQLPVQPTLVLGAGTEPANWSNTRSPVRFTVDVIPHGVRKKREILFDKTVDSRIEQANRKWRDVSVDLDKWAGQEVTLRFSTTVAAPDAPPYSYSFWSEPRLRGETMGRNSRNAVIHLIDTLRKDHLGCYGYDKDTSPTIDALALQGVLFEDPVSQWPATKGSTASLLTGLYPIAHGVHMGGTVHQQAQMLAQALAAEGYLTFAISDNHMVTAERGFGRGCDRFYSMRDRHGSEIPSQTPAPLIMETVRECLEAVQGHPFFLYVHSNYPHDQYWAPAEFREKFTRDYQGMVDGNILTYRARQNEMTETDFKQIHALYDAEIRYADALTKDILEALTAARVRDETLFVLTADHGEEFMDHGGWGHCHTLFGELLNVPLIFEGLSLPSRRRIPQTVRLIDVAPTVLDVLELPPMNCHGESLLPLVRGEDEEWRIAVSEGGVPDKLAISIRDRRYKYVKTQEVEVSGWVTGMSDGEFLFDLLNDPEERNNLLESKPGLVEQMGANVTRYYDQYRGWFGGPSGSKLSADEIRELKAVGYLR